MWNALISLCLVMLGAPSVEWTTDVDAGLARAAETQSVVLLSLGSATEARSETFVRDVYKSKSAKAYMARSVNLAAWTWPADEVKLLPDFGDYEPMHHTTVLERAKERWLRPNELGVVAQPQHVWLSPGGEVLVSCPFELDALEFAWCFDAALRRAGIEERPALPKGAHPPRRLLLGEVHRLANDDEYGRGLWPRELEVVLEEFQKRNLSMADAGDVRRIMFTDDPEAADAIADEFGKWDLASGFARDLSGILDGTVYLLGRRSSARFLPALEQFTRHPRASLRAQVAAAYEQIGDPAGFAAVKQALKKEKDDELRVAWIRALGACGRSNAAASKELMRIAQKDKHEPARHAAILALGYVLPEAKARDFLVERVEEGDDPERRAALIALGLGRATDERELVARWAAEGVDPSVQSVAEAVLTVLDGGNLIGLREAAGDLTADSIERWRIFFPSSE
jgi:HEAT repeat protein